MYRQVLADFWKEFSLLNIICKKLTIDQCFPYFYYEQMRYVFQEGFFNAMPILLRKYEINCNLLLIIWLELLIIYDFPIHWSTNIFWSIQILNSQIVELREHVPFLCRCFHQFWLHLVFVFEVIYNQLTNSTQSPSIQKRSLAARIIFAYEQICDRPQL